MIQSILSSLAVIFAVFIAEYLCSSVFGSIKGAKQFIIELLFFLLILNLFLFNIVIAEDFYIQLFVLFLTAFVSLVSSRTIGFLLFKTVAEKFAFKQNKFNTNSIRLAKLLYKKMSKEQVIDLFREAGFKTPFLDHLDSIFRN